MQTLPPTQGRRKDEVGKAGGLGAEDGRGASFLFSGWGECSGDRFGAPAFPYQKRFWDKDVPTIQRVLLASLVRGRSHGN